MRSSKLVIFGIFLALIGPFSAVSTARADDSSRDTTRVMEDPNLAEDQKEEYLDYQDEHSGINAFVSSPSGILLGICLLSCISYAVVLGGASRERERERDRRPKRPSRSSVWLRRRITESKHLDMVAEVDLADEGRQNEEVIVETPTPRLPGSQAEVDAIPYAQRGVSFFTSRPAPISQLFEVEVEIGSKIIAVRATFSEAELVVAGCPPRVRGFTCKGVTRPWYKWPDYNPYKHYWRGSRLGRVTFADDVIPCWLTLAKLFDEPVPLYDYQAQPWRPVGAPSTLFAPSAHNDLRSISNQSAVQGEPNPEIAGQPAEQPPSLNSREPETQSAALAPGHPGEDAPAEDQRTPRYGKRVPASNAHRVRRRRIGSERSKSRYRRGAVNGTKESGYERICRAHLEVKIECVNRRIRLARANRVAARLTESAQNTAALQRSLNLLTDQLALFEMHERDLSSALSAIAVSRANAARNRAAVSKVPSSRASFKSRRRVVSGTPRPALRGKFVWRSGRTRTVLQLSPATSSELQSPHDLPD